MQIIGLGGSKPPSGTPEDDALRFEPAPPDASQSQYSAGHSASLPGTARLGF